MSQNPIWKGGLAFSPRKKANDLTVAEDKTFDAMLYKYEMLCLMAYHLSLSKTNILDKNVSSEILSTLSSMYETNPSDLGSSEDVHSFVEESFARIDKKSSEYLRILLSRNDQSHTDIRLFSIDGLLDLKIKLLRASLQIKSKKTEKSMVMPGFTHYRQAMPLTWATYLDHLSSILLEEAQRISKVIEDLKELPLGYGSGFGNDIPLDWNIVAKLLGMRKSNLNPFHMASFRGLDEMRILDSLKEILLRLSRVSQDLIMWSSDDTGFIHLPMEFITGSSLMANKKNADFLEMLEGYATQLLSDSLFTSAELVSKSSGYHRDFQISKWKVLSSIKLVGKIVENFGDLVEGVNFDTEKAKKIILNSSYATGHAAKLVLSGMPWKEAYSRVGSMIQKGSVIPEYQVKEYKNTERRTINGELKKGELELEERNSCYSSLVKMAATTKLK